MAAIKVIKSIRLDSKGVREEIWMARVPFIR